MIDMNKKYTCKGGNPVRIYADGSDTYDNDIHGAIANTDGWVVASFRECDLVEVWEPKEGELVWCWNAEDKMPSVRYYDKSTGTVFWMKDLSLRSDFYVYHHIAPFTCELPEAFKGLRND